LSLTPAEPPTVHSSSRLSPQQRLCEVGIVSPPRDSVPETALIEWFRELPSYVILRNEADLFRHIKCGGDIDVLVADIEKAEHTLIRHLGVPVRIIRSSYVRGYSYDWGHIDLLPAVEWRGARFLSTEAVLGGRRRSPSGRPVPRPAHEALISWFTNLLFGGFFKERYAPAIRHAVEVDGRVLHQTLLEVAGEKLGTRLWQAAVDGHAEISAEWTRSLRLAVWRRACFRSPVRTIQRYLAFAIAEVKLRFEPAVPWIAILGSDRYANSSLADEIVHRFAACRYAKVIAVHRRPRPRLMARSQGAEPVIDLHRRSSRGPIGSGLRFLVMADWLVGYWTRLVHLRAKGYILAFDRIYFDPVDPKCYPYGAGPRLARALWRLLPTPDLVFLLDSEPGVLWRRKQEVPAAELARQRDAHRASRRQLPASHVLNGSLQLSVLADEIQRIIRAWMVNRSAASLGWMQAPMTAAPSASSEGSSPARRVIEPR
jgi:hypothetical protein